MSHGHNKLQGYGEVRSSPRAAVSTVERMAPLPQEPLREIVALRSINANLIREIAALKQREARTQRLADRDALTGLYNRRRMLELLEDTILAISGKKQRIAVLFLDLDGFKAINDQFGHAAGDKLLTTVGARIAARVRKGDIVCRYGGDEFVVLLPQVPDDAAVEKVAAIIRERVALPYRIGSAQVRVSAAIGISLYPEDGQCAASLLHRADESMYRAKALLA